MFSQPLYLQILIRVFQDRQHSNPSYSLRAFSRDIGLDPSTTSQILRGRRWFPRNAISKSLTALRLSPKEQADFLDSVSRKPIRLDEIAVQVEPQQLVREEAHYRVIAEWEHFAVLSLADIQGFVISPENVADRLGLALNRAEQVIQNLLDAGFLTESDGTLRPSHSNFSTSEDVVSSALREFHGRYLKNAASKLESVPLEERDFSCVTFSYEAADIGTLKSLIREFRKKILTLSKKSKRADAVYQMGLQLIPVTSNTGELK